jgi:zinc protease
MTTLNRKAAPPIKDAVDYSLALKTIQMTTLRNGIKVHHVQAGAQEVVQIELVFFAGNSFQSKRGVAAATNFLLKNGTSKKTAFEINETFDFYGAFCSRSCYNETATITLHSLSKHAPQVLPLIREILTDSTLPEEELTLYKQNSIQRLKVNLQKADFVAGRLIDNYVYGDTHPYGRMSEIIDIESIDIASCREFYNQYYQNGNCLIFVSGNYPDNLIDLLDSLLGDLPITSCAVPTPNPPVVPAAQMKYRIHNDPEAVQGAIRLATPFPNRHHPDFIKVSVLNTVFGGYFGSRLMSNIREDKGYTYGIYSYVQNHLQQSAWVISTEAGKDVSEATIEEIYKEMKRLREEPIDEEELLLVRNYLIGTILGDLDGPFHIMGKWKNYILNNLDDRYFYDSVREIKTIQADELMELSKKYLVPEKFYELIVY